MTPDAYHAILRGLLEDAVGIIRRNSEVLGRFHALEDRIHEAKRDMERAEMEGTR